MFRIKNSGLGSKTCSMSRKIRQGCPISALFYLFVAKILSLKLKTCNQIKDIKLNNTSTKIKKIHYADDETLALKDVKSLEKSIQNVENFCNDAGSKIIKKKYTVYTHSKSQRQVQRRL